MPDMYTLEQKFTVSIACNLNEQDLQRAGGKEELYSPLRNEGFSDLLKVAHVIAVRAQNWKQDSGAPKCQNKETRLVQNVLNSD